MLFPLAFGVDTKISIEIEAPSFRTMYHIKEWRHEALRVGLDLPEERKNNVDLNTIIYNQKNARYYNQKVHQGEFEVDELMLRHVLLTTRRPNSRSLGQNRECTYKITKILTKARTSL